MKGILLMVYFRLKTPRRCLLQDLAHARDESDEEIAISPTGSFALPAKRQFSRTKTAFGRLQGPKSNDTQLNSFKKFQFEDESTKM